jgi:hypothetical protein
MNLATAVRSSRTEHPLGAAELAVVGAVVAVAVGVAAAVPDRAGARWFLAAVFAAVLAFVCLRSTVQGLVVTVLWLVMLGATRRLASEIVADPGRDPLVLVGAVATAVLTARAMLAGAARGLTPLAGGLLAFNALAVVEMLNPDQPAGLGRVAGLLVWVLPTLWFWVGRAFVDAALARRIVLIAAGATTLTALYGIAQSLAGFPPWDESWVDRRGYAALFIGPDTVRPFGTYASAAEFALSCAVGAVVAATAAFAPSLLVASRARRGRRRRARQVVGASIVLFGITFAGLVLSAVRTALVLLVVALPVVYLVARGRRAWKVLAVATVVGAGAVTALAQVDPDSVGTVGPQAAVRRILVLVNDPFASNRENTDNTLELHVENAKQGFSDAWSHPFGHGTGSTGIAGEHFGGGSRSTDLDLSDAGVAFGLLGLVLAVGIVVLGFVTGVRAALRDRSFESVALVGVLVVSFGAWFQGAHYAMAPLLWLLLGRAERSVLGR